MQDGQKDKYQKLFQEKKRQWILHYISDVRNKSRYKGWQYLEKSGALEWDKIISDLYDLLIKFALRLWSSAFWVSETVGAEFRVPNKTEKEFKSPLDF